MKSTRIESRPVADLRRADYNPRRISDRAMSGLRESVTRFGLVQPIIVNERTGCVVGGHQRLRVLEGEGVAETDVVVVDLDEAEERALNVALNNPHISGEFTDDLDDLLQRIVADTPDLFDALRLDDLLDDAIQVVEPAGGGVDDHGVLPDDPTSPASTPGDLWLLGDHRILCGDATSEESVQGLLDGTDVDLILTDPPYCSGGFQEAGKSRGSVGTTSVHKHVANDRLSTRGYAALLRRAFAVAGGDYIYAFTDWRMWVHLFDIVEGSGYGVRSMIVWDKGHPGMGRGWRSQHELIMWGCRSTPPFDKHASGGGNVIQAARTGNPLHTTQKPVDLLSALLIQVPFARTVIDPFMGSGSTLIACEGNARRFLGVELDPGYVDTTVMRWQALTGNSARLEGDGRTFEEVRVERG